MREYLSQITPCRSTVWSKTQRATYVTRCLWQVSCHEIRYPDIIDDFCIAGIKLVRSEKKL